MNAAIRLERREKAKGNWRYRLSARISARVGMEYCFGVDLLQDLVKGGSDEGS